MSFRAFHRRLLAGMVLFALLLQTMLPAVAGAAAGPADRWVEVCAASGLKWVKLDQDAAAGSHTASDHCALCAATGATPEFDAARYLRSSLAESRPAIKPSTPFQTFPSHLLRSRAPPPLS